MIEERPSCTELPTRRRTLYTSCGVPPEITLTSKTFHRDDATHIVAFDAIAAIGPGFVFENAFRHTSQIRRKTKHKWQVKRQQTRRALPKTLATLCSGTPQAAAAFSDGPHIKPQAHARAPLPGVYPYALGVRGHVLR